MTSPERVIFTFATLGKAGKAGAGAMVGFLLGTIAKIALGFSMLGTYLVARFF